MVLSWMSDERVDVVVIGARRERIRRATEMEVAMIVCSS